MRKLILRNGFSPGDVVMLTAALRDLHYWYPGQFVTDVRTCCPELWEHNPQITPLSDDDPEAEQIECTYPLINHCNQKPYHCLHGFIDFLNERLKLAIKPSAFKGDIYLSELEKSWYSQVHELTGEDTPFWIIAAGGKYDLTIKWWASDRYQQVVRHFRGRVQFVAVGQHGHHHPKLEGVIDLRGRTNLRELVRLVYHSQGVLCGVTALMHLAAAVEFKGSRLRNRPCVVVAGGREPSHWEAYPDHQFIHTNGALHCCASGGCWRDRVMRLGDGDRRDRPENLCVNVVQGLPRCMDMIAPEEVIRRIELYYHGGVLKYLTPRQRRAAQKGITASQENPYDHQPLTLHDARMACEQFIKTISPYPENYRGQGIVICCGGVRYFTNAWVCINMLRRLGCTLPIQVWHLGRKEMDERMKSILAPLGVDCVDAYRVRRKHPARMLGGWELKPYAIVHCPFREVLLLDADNVAVINPEFLFETPQYRATGAIFWPDYGLPSKKALPVWRSCGMRRPNEREFESGQIVVNKESCWEALQLCVWFNENSDFYYRYVHGDKETFHLAFRKLKKSYALVDTPIRTLAGTMCQHDFDGKRVFQHRNTDKWNLLLLNKRVPGFAFEEECRQYVRGLQQIWDGRMSSVSRRKAIETTRRGIPAIRAVMISCPERADLRRKTLKRLNRTDWDVASLHVVIDSGTNEDRQQRQSDVAFRALRWGLETDADYLLFLEDDLDFNLCLRHNLENWQPVTDGEITLAGLYNPNLRESACDVARNALIVEPRRIFGSQAFLLSRTTLKYVVQNWNRVKGMQDIRISRLAGRLKQSIYYHSPSLVQHVGHQSVWGGGFHQAADFDAHWKAA